MTNIITGLKNNFYTFTDFSFQKTKTTTKVIATATLIIPLAIGVKEICKGYIENKHDTNYSLPEKDDSLIKKIIACANPFLVLTVGFDELWSEYSYRKISEGSLASLSQIQILSLSSDKQSLLISRDDYVQSLPANKIFSLDRLYCTDSNILYQQLTQQQIIDYTKYLVGSSLITYKLRFLVQHPNFAINAVFQSLTDSEKTTFFSSLRYSNQFNLSQFIQSLSTSDLILLNIYSIFKNHLTNVQILVLLTNPNGLSAYDLKSLFNHAHKNTTIDLRRFVRSLSMDQIISFEIYKDETLINYLTQPQVEELLTFKDGPGLTPDIFNLLNKSKLQQLDLASIRFTSHYYGRSNCDISMNIWLSRINASYDSDIFDKLTKEQILYIFNKFSSRLGKKRFRNFLFNYPEFSSDYSKTSFLKAEFKKILKKDKPPKQRSYNYGSGSSSSYNGHSNFFNIFFDKERKEALEAAAVLGVQDIEGDRRSIKKVYFGHVRRLNNGRNNQFLDSSQEETLKQINAAYDTLTQWREKNGYATSKS